MFYKPNLSFSYSQNSFLIIDDNLNSHISADSVLFNTKTYKVKNTNMKIDSKFESDTYICNRNNL